MSTAKFDVTAIGNAIVDVIAQADDAFLEKHKLPKGAMNLIDAETAERLYGDMGARQGSVGRIGRQHHRRHRGARRAHGLHRQGGEGSARRRLHARHARRRRGLRHGAARRAACRRRASLIFVTPDAQRTMQTFLGATHAARSRGRQHGLHHRVEGAVPRGLPLGSAAREGGDARMRRSRRRRRA